MSQMTLPELAKKMRDIDFTMLMTRTAGGEIAGRPMSNNGEVDYDGDSYFFTWERSRMVDDVLSEPKVGLTFQGHKGILGKPPLMITVEGEAEVIRDTARFAEHWNKGLDRWFEQGVDTPGVVMLKVHASRIGYWDGEEHGDITV